MLQSKKKETIPTQKEIRIIRKVLNNKELTIPEIYQIADKFGIDKPLEV